MVLGAFTNCYQWRQRKCRINQSLCWFVSGTTRRVDNFYFGGTDRGWLCGWNGHRPTSTLESAANANIARFSSAGYYAGRLIRMDTTLAASIGALEMSNGTVNNRALIYALRRHRHSRQ